MMHLEPGPERPDPRPREEPEETPVTPPNEPKPAPVQDPPAEPNTSPYVVRGQAGQQRELTMNEAVKGREPGERPEPGARKERRGFASMSPEKQREIASKGGRAAHQKGTAHEWTSEEARSAGRKGGQISRGGRGRLADETGPGMADPTARPSDDGDLDGQ